MSGNTGLRLRVSLVLLSVVPVFVKLQGSWESCVPHIWPGGLQSFTFISYHLPCLSAQMTSL